MVQACGAEDELGLRAPRAANARSASHRMARRGGGMLLEAGLVRRYAGGRREPWC